MTDAKSIPEQDFLIYDADCGFCQKSVDVMKKLTGEKIVYYPSYEIEDGFYGIERDSFNSSIKFFEHKEKEVFNEYEKIQTYEYHSVHEDAVLYHGAYAIFKALSANPLFAIVLFAYEKIPLVSVVMEAGYRIVARNRMHISKALGVEACKIN